MLYKSANYFVIKALIEKVFQNVCIHGAILSSAQNSSLQNATFKTLTVQHGK